MDNEMNEFEVSMFGIKVGQAFQGEVGRLLESNGCIILGQGYTDGSTSWVVWLADDTEECPAGKEEAVDAREFLWGHGYGFVAIVEVKPGKDVIVELEE